MPAPFRRTVKGSGGVAVQEGAPDQHMRGQLPESFLGGGKGTFVESGRWTRRFEGGGVIREDDYI